MLENHKLLICDLDNTLYDWVGYFVRSFYAMVDEVVRITNCDRERLLDDFREVHKEHHDSEHPFALLETQTIKDLYDGASRDVIADALDPAFYAFNSNRKHNLKLYPGVSEGLKSISDLNIPIVAHTESNLYAVTDRLTRLDLMKYFRRVYCKQRPNSVHPNPEAAVRFEDAFGSNKIIELSHHQRKPDSTVLEEICERENVTPEMTIYVGDSIARDMLMAKNANAFAAWAKYGSEHDKEEFKKLVRISHWTNEDVEREKRLEKRANNIKLDYVLYDSFSEILNIFDDPQAKVAAQN